MSATKHVAVVGGGISGMSAALAITDLARGRGLPPPRVTVLESADRVGGKIRTLTADGFTCEWGVNGFLNKEPRTLELVNRLGLDDHLLPASDAFSNRFIYNRGRLRAVKMHPLKFLFSGLMTLGGMIRLVRELWVPQRAADAGDESVADFSTRRIGPQAYQVLVDPMQTGIYAGDPEQMSVAASFPRVVEVERQYGSLIRGMMKIAKERKAAQSDDAEQESGDQPPGAGPSGHLTSFKGGMEVLVGRLAEELGDAVHLEADVRELRREEGGYQLAGRGMVPLAADAVVLACPAHAAAPMTRNLAPQISELVGQVPYSPLAVVCLGYERDAVAHPMDGFGFLVPRTAGLRILGVLWTSSIFPERCSDGRVLVRAMIGGARDPEVLDLSDEELRGLVHGEVSAAQGIEGEPAFARIFRHRRGIPQYTLGHLDRLAQIEAHLQQLPGLIMSGNAWRGVSVNDCAKNAWDVAEKALAHL